MLSYMACRARLYGTYTDTMLGIHDYYSIRIILFERNENIYSGNARIGNDCWRVGRGEEETRISRLIAQYDLNIDAVARSKKSYVSVGGPTTAGGQWCPREVVEPKWPQ